MGESISVLIVDDSLLVRTALEQGLNAVPGIQVIGTAADPYEARDKLVRLRPQVMTLDIEMPRMDGLTFLRRLLPQWPIPVIMVSSLTERGADSTLRALAIGAVDFVAKPTASMGSHLQSMIDELARKIKVASLVNSKAMVASKTEASTTSAPSVDCSALPQNLRARLQAIARPKLVAIGASTGGTQALHAILAHLPHDMPPIVAVQHMPPSFTALFAQRLNATSPLQVREASDGDVLRDGEVYIAPGGHQLRVTGTVGSLRLRIRDEGLINGHQPSVEPLFSSCLPIAPVVCAVMLTGMGADGAEAMASLHSAGAFTIGQDHKSSVVYGMPRVAFERGAIDEQMPLDHIAPTIAMITQNALQRKFPRGG